LENSYLTPAQGRLYAQTVPLLRAGLLEADARRLREEGQRMTVQVALAYATSGWAD
jgi:hypothetical protein